MSKECSPHLEIFNDKNSLIHTAHVVVPSSTVQRVYSEAVRGQIEGLPTHGFQEQSIPVSYINTHYRSHLVDHLKEFLLKYIVVDFMYNEMRKKNIITIGEPRLKHIELSPEGEGRYSFEFTPASVSPVRDWKFLPFKAPVRKKYKDIDKQAESFLATEINNEKLLTGDTLTINSGDWVSFGVQWIDSNERSIIENHTEILWLQIGDSETCISYQELFIGKSLGEKFITNHECIQEYFSNKLDTNYRYNIEILEILPAKQLSIPDFKLHFKLKSNRKVQQKLIEVFSFRNDISLRRLMVEEAFRVLLKTYPQAIPHSATLRQQKVILDLLQHNPDYMVYKKQHDFLDKVAMLAEKQILEILIIDQFAVQENITVTHTDVRYYLNMTKRPRTKEFLYFQHGALRANDEESPIGGESLKQACLREKTLNHLLHHLCRS